eukprot:s336_g6.t2
MLVALRLKRLSRVIDSCIIVYPKMESQAATRDIESAPQEDQEPEVSTETSEEREDTVVSRPDQVRRVTFQLPAESGSPAVVERHAHRGRLDRPNLMDLEGDTTRSGASPWRYPKASQTIPVYVERAFRVKTFALVSVQQGVCFGIMLMMHVFILIEEAKGRNRLKKSTGLEVAYYSLSLIDMLCLMQLWIVRNSFPTNYCLMLAMTILSGLLWGLTETVLMTKMHLQLMANTTITFAVASLLSAVLTREKPWCKKERIVPIALSIGWTVGTVVVVTVSEMYHIGRIWEPVLACGFVSLLLTLLLFETRRTLLCSNPDDFMMCIVILNASMLCLVSIPFFVILYGFLYVHRDEMDEESEPVAAVAAPSPAPLDAP